MANDPFASDIMDILLDIPDLWIDESKYEEFDSDAWKVNYQRRCDARLLADSLAWSLREKGYGNREVWSPEILQMFKDRF